VARGGGRFEPRTVQLGVHGDGWVQVLSGIEPGDNVVVGANFLIDSESNVRAALQNFANALKSNPQGASK
jgi:membrane fusion protein, copper/silver efflux system